MEFGRKPMSLLELCVRKAIDNVRYMDSVDGVEMDLLKRILPHCTLEHLTNIEEHTEMDLSSVTNPLWKRFYLREFGQEHYNDVIARLKASPDVSYTWCQLFKARQRKQKEAEDEMLEKFTKKFQAEKAEKQSKQIKLCTKVPPSSKRSFFGGNGPSSLSNCSYKSPMLKKAKREADSRARLQSAIQKNTFARSSQPIRTTSFGGQQMRTTTIHRPNKTITITTPERKSRQIQNSRHNSTINPMGKGIQIQNSRPNSTITPMGKGMQIQNSRPNSTITPMGKGMQIQNSIPNSTITTMGKGRQIQNSIPNSTMTPMAKGRQIQNSRPKF